MYEKKLDPNQLNNYFNSSMPEDDRRLLGEKLVLFFAEKGEAKTCLKLIANDATLVKAQDSNGRTPLVIYLRALSIAGRYDVGSAKPKLDVNVTFLKKCIELYPEVLFLFDKEGLSAISYTFSDCIIDSPGGICGFTASGAKASSRENAEKYPMAVCFQILIEAGAGLIKQDSFSIRTKNIIREKEKFVLLPYRSSRHPTFMQICKKFGYKTICDLNDLQANLPDLSLLDLKRFMNQIELCLKVIKMFSTDPVKLSFDDDYVKDLLTLNVNDMIEELTPMQIYLRKEIMSKQGLLRFCLFTIADKLQPEKIELPELVEEAKKLTID